MERLRDKPLDKTDRELRQLRATLRRSPNQLPLALAVAQHCLQIARRDGDPRYTGYAQAALVPWWNDPDGPAPVRLYRAIILQSVHQFPAALNELSTLVRTDPSNAQVWMTRASIYQVQGRYAEATADCERLAAMGRNNYAEACLAELQSLTGAAVAAYERLERLADANPALAAWLQLIEAELQERAGDAASANGHFQKAIALSGDAYTRAAYADFLLDHQRPAEVVLLLQGSERADPLLLRLALAYQQGRDARLADAVLALRARFDAAHLRGDTVHQREEARFDLALLRDNDAALRLARENWQVQKEPADARILLAAARAAHRDADAEPVRQFIARNHLADVRLAPFLK